MNLRTLTAMLGLVTLGWLSGYDRLQIALLVCLCRILGLRRLGPLALVTVLYILVARPFSGLVTNHWPGFELVLRSRYADYLLELPPVKYFGLLARLAAGYLLYRAVRNLGRGAKLLVLHLGGLALIFLGEALLPFGPAAGAVTGYALISFSFFFFYLCYIALENPHLSPLRFARLYLANFWENSTSPRPVMELSPISDPQGQLTSRCLKSAWTTAALVAAGALAQALIYGSPWRGYSLPNARAWLPDLTMLGPTPELFLVYSRLEIGLSVLWTGLHRITNYFALFVFIECCHLMLGHEVPRRFSFPWRARSFGDFYNSIMPYYVMVVNRIYLYPYFSALRKWGWNRRVAYDLALFGAIFSAGLVTHCLRDVHLVALIGAKEFLVRSFWTDLSYCSLLFLAIRLVKTPRFLAWPFRFAWLLSVYSGLIFFRVGGLFVSFEERLHFMRCLLLGPA